MSPAAPRPNTPSSTEVTDCDVLVVGGGLVGASLAIALEPLGLRTVMLEATPPGALPAVFDQRNLSLAEASLNALARLGVLAGLKAPTGPIRRIHISRAGDFGRVLLEAGDHGRARFGEVVVARDFGEALEARLASLRHLVRLRPARFLGFEADDGAVRRVRIGDDTGERVLAARLVVAADGTHSAVREALGIGAQQHDYRQTLFVARVRADRAPDGTAWERLGDHGPTAILPRGDGAYGTIHGVATEDADAVEALADAGYLARLQAAFGWRAGRFREVGPRSRYAIVRVQAERLAARRAVLVGNAAQSLHPIGAQGFNLGLRDALTLVECIAAHRDDPGADTVLSTHAARRAGDRARTITFSDGLARATALDHPLASPARALGLLALDRDAALRARLVAGAMGYRGDVPALCRPEAA